MGSCILAAGMADIEYADWTGDTDSIAWCYRKKTDLAALWYSILENYPTFNDKNHGRIFTGNLCRKQRSSAGISI